MSRVDRTVTEVRAAPDDKRVQPAARPLTEYREVPAYVLLGDPGAGKSTAFKKEREALGKSAIDVIPANEFLTYDTNTIPPEWRDKTLFIDGLDEIRAGTQDGSANLREIIRLLRALHNPRFRLSCRAADWLGERDRRLLSGVALSGSLVILRIDPLTDPDILQILSNHEEIADAHEFVRTARERGVGTLLENPLTLKLLAKVVGHETCWPASRVELFERAASLLTIERNIEHSTADPQPPPAELLDAAGRLCAVLLVSGATGYALDRGQANAEYLDVSQCEYEGPQLLRSALSTGLFTVKAEGCFAPIHPHIAEFVGARHLARVIREGLPASRVTALLTGSDGGVVTSLRGIAALLAAVSEGARRDLIERDPIGVISYGDPRAFSAEHKEMLLRALGREDSRLDWAVWTESALGAVAARGMEPALRKILERRNEHPPTLVAFVLYALKHGERLPSLAESLIQVVYGDNRRAEYPAWALEAFVHNCPGQQAALDRLERLLQDLSTGGVKDWQDQLTGVALHRLYPGRIPPAKIWDYLTESPNRHPDDYRSFWRSGLIDRSEPDDIATLLDELATRRLRLKPTLESRHLEELPVELLARGLELRGGSIDREQLLDWLRVDLFSDTPRTSHEAARRIGAWLGKRPEIQQAVVSDYVNRSELPIINHRINEILYGSSPPPDFGDWSLRQARAASEPGSAEVYLRLALARGVRLDVLLEYEHEKSPLREIMKQMLVCPLPDGFYDTFRESRTSWQDESTCRRRGFVARVRTHEDDLHGNRCNPPLLEALANMYFGGYSDVTGQNPQDRLRDLFCDEPRLIDATLAGFRGAPFRGDIHSAREIVGLLKTGGRSRFALPVLAGIDELDDLRELSDRQLRQALAFHFTTFTEYARNRGRRLVEVNTSVAADILVQCTTAKMRVGTYDDMIGYELAVGEYVALASPVVLPVLRSFSVRRAQPEAMTMLDELFIAALLHAERATFLELVAEKLACTSMSAAQRVRWLAAQVVAAPYTCVDRLRKFVARQERRGLQLAAFLLRIGPQLDELPTPTLVAFIELLGRTVLPWDPTDSSGLYDRFGRDAADCVRQMARTLSDRPDEDTAAELERLCTEPTLNRWYQTLVDARDRQRVVLRDATYRHPTVEQASRTLNGGNPSNAADLAALVTDRLRVLARRIRTSNTDDWKQYWDQHSAKPKYEDQCRNMLLSDLQLLLPEAVDARREGSYANDTRADIRVAFQGFEAPVEIKRSEHRALWSAVQSQLMAKYTSDPATGGYGVYLVFWFGKDLTQAPLEGSIPDDADELGSRLEGILSDAERRKISVVVIDVSRP